MSDAAKVQAGSVMWVDLTVPDAGAIRDFYSRVVGWRPEPVDMGEYSDFNMLPPGSDRPAAGVCYARGINAGIPPQWMIYIAVEDMDQCVQTCLDLGGSVVAAPRGSAEEGRVCVIRDPAGAVAALYQPAK